MKEDRRTAILFAVPMILVGIGMIVGLIVFLTASGEENTVRRRCKELLDAFRRQNTAEIMSFCSRGKPEPGKALSRLSEKLRFVRDDIVAVTMENDVAVAVVSLQTRPDDRERIRMTIQFRATDGVWYLDEFREPPKQ